jgi:uncharacterized membrane protein
VQRHGYHLGRAKNPLPFAIVGVLLLLGVIVALKPTVQPQTAASQAPVSFAQVQSVLAQRCYMCHGEAAQMKGIRLDQLEAVQLHAQGIYQQVAVTRQMPLNNATQITEDERQLIKRWFEGGAALQ